MTLIEKLRNINEVKFSFGKNNTHHRQFSQQISALSMYESAGFGLDIPTHLSSEHQLRAIFLEVSKRNGIYIFNLNGVDLTKAKTGFTDYDEAESNNMITEWELFMILNNEDYLRKTIFHNGKVEFTQIENGLNLIW
ncbi:MAG: hypothetical protein QM541_12510 [Flavobacterium sp.]|nr:hypothetical protein [Flavobacterium sp.]